MIDTTVKEIVFRLKTQNIQVSPVVIEGSEPTEWKRNLKKFLAEFFGSTPNAAECKLLNPEVLDFAVEEYTSEFTATVCEPLVIENKALGYRLYYYLQYFQLKNKQHHFFGTGNFEQLHTESTEEIKRWKINRENTYHGSKRHFFPHYFIKTPKRKDLRLQAYQRN